MCCAGRKAANDQAHSLLPNALWKGPVQQCSVEELEYGRSASPDNHWK